jgi:hypothetical protein
MEKIGWTDLVRNEVVLHTVEFIRNILPTLTGRRLAGLVTSCVGTAFQNTLLKERKGEG